MSGEIARAVRGDLEEQLARYGCALILGPRQVGKTTLARQLFEKAGNTAIILDMQRQIDRREIRDLQHFHDVNAGKLIILDEAQAAPELFPQLRACLDRRNFNGDKTRWLLLGSAAAQLTQMAGQLGGRYGIIDLWPFQLSELTDAQPMAAALTAAGDAVTMTVTQSPATDNHEVQQRIWLRGGFPDSYLAKDEYTSLEWRSNYLKSLTDTAFIPDGAVGRSDLVKPIWDYLAINQGEPLVFDKAAQRLGCKMDIVRHVLVYLLQTRLVRELRPWFPNEGKRVHKPARYFIRDSGLLHENWGFNSIKAVRDHQLCGKSWEGFVLESISARLQKSARLYFYRNKKQQEVDIVIDFGADRRWAIEVKSGDNTAPRVGFYDVVQEVAPERAFVINGGRESFEPDGKVPIVCLSDALRLFHEPSTVS